MSKLKAKISQFHLVGQLSGFVLKDGCKLKYLKVTVSQLEYWLKFPKELLKQISPDLTSGCWLEINGTRKQSQKTGVVKLKAEKVKILSPAENISPGLEIVPNQAVSPSILVCHSSTCRKRGAKILAAAIEEGLQGYSLGSEVVVQPSGCLKRCKKGPNLMVMPGGLLYDRVTLKQVPTLLQRHFALQK